MITKINNELFLLIGGRILQVILALVTVKISTKYLEASEMGNLYFLFSIGSFFSFFFISPIGQYINRKTHQWFEEKSLMNVMYVYNFYILFISLLSSGIVLILKFFNIGANIDLIYLVIIIPIFVYFNTWNQTIIPMINMLEKRIAFVILTLLSQLLYLSLAYLFINIFGSKGILWFLGQAISYGILAFVALIYFKKNLQNHFNKLTAYNMIDIKNLQIILKYSLPLSVGVLFFWIQSQSYNIIIEKNIGSEFLGHLGVGIAIALAIANAFETVVMQFLYPKLYKSMNNRVHFKHNISRIINLILPIYFILVIFVSLFAIYINSILVDVKYFDSYIYLIFGSWIAFFKMSSNIISNIAHSQMNTKSLIFPNFIGAFFTIFGVIIATYTCNYDLWIPIVLLFASIISFLFMYYNMQKLEPFQLKIKNFLNVILYSIPLLGGMFFYRYSDNLLSSFIIILVFGLYFVYVVFYLIKKEKIIE